MRTALLHYWLTNIRGGEKVLAELCRMFPGADIFTHAYNRERTGAPFSSHRVVETGIARLPGARNNCQKYLPLMPSALNRLDFSGYDLILSSESGPAKGIRKPSGAVHVCYCHTPMRYLWDMYEDYYRAAGVAGKLAMTLFKKYLRNYDLRSADAVDHFIANSRFVAERIKRIYGRDSTVIHPPADVGFFQAGQFEKKGYFLFVGQLIDYKRPELALEACRKMDCRLVIAGDGPLKKRLAERGGDRVSFSGRVEGENLRRLYGEADALIFPGIEDFGIVPVEAQAAGTPVIALARGGALETVAPDTGVFFSEPDVDSLCSALEEFRARSFDSAVLKRHAESFSVPVFHRNMRRFLSRHVPGFGQ